MSGAHLRHVTQIAAAVDPNGSAWVVALCDDGTIFTFDSATALWTLLPPVPGTRQPGTVQPLAEHPRP